MIRGFRDGRKMLPRIAKIRLGVKKEGQRGSYPSDTDHFVLTDCPEVAKVYGEAPKAIMVMFASDDIEVNFPTALEAWKASPAQAGQAAKSKKFCSSDGETANRMWVGEKDTQGLAIVRALPADERPDLGDYFEMPCPYEECPYYESKACKRVGRLNVLLPEVSLSGIYQVETSSAWAFGNILDMIGPDGWAMRMTASQEFPSGRIAFRVPFELYREPQSITFEGKATVKAILKLRVIDDDERLSRLSVKVPAWMRGKTLFSLTAAPEADHPEDNFPEESGRVIPALPAPGQAFAAALPAPSKPEKPSLQEQAKQAGVTKAKLEFWLKKHGGEVEKVEAEIAAFAAAKAAPAPPAPAPAPARPPAPSSAAKAPPAPVSPPPAAAPPRTVVPAQEEPPHSAADPAEVARNLFQDF